MARRVRGLGAYRRRVRPTVAPRGAWVRYRDRRGRWAAFRRGRWLVTVVVRRPVTRRPRRPRRAGASTWVSAATFRARRVRALGLGRETIAVIAPIPFTWAHPVWWWFTPRRALPQGDILYIWLVARLDVANRKPVYVQGRIRLDWGAPIDPTTIHSMSGPIQTFVEESMEGRGGSLIAGWAKRVLGVEGVYPATGALVGILGYALRSVAFPIFRRRARHGRR